MVIVFWGDPVIPCTIACTAMPLWNRSIIILLSPSYNSKIPANDESGVKENGSMKGKESSNAVLNAQLLYIKTKKLCIKVIIIMCVFWNTVYGKLYWTAIMFINLMVFEFFLSVWLFSISNQCLIKYHGMCCPVCWKVHIKYPLLLMGK